MNTYIFLFPPIHSLSSPSSSSSSSSQKSKEEGRRQQMTSRQLFLLAILFVVSASAHESPKYSYSESDGPDKWASLSPDYKQCSEGNLQSPINIEPKEAKSEKDVHLERNYESYIKNTVLVNTGTHIELVLNPEDGSSKFNGSIYKLAYITFKTPAEHTIDNKTFAMELQIVHKDQDGKELIVSIMHRIGSADTFLYRIKDSLEKLAADKCGDGKEARVAVEDELKTKTLTKAGGKYFGYVGSQTVPPCKQGVLWFISKKVRTVSTEQLVTLQAPLSSEHNSRPVFPISSDKILKYDD